MGKNFDGQITINIQLLEYLLNQYNLLIHAPS